jgi:hypothetical protein
MVPDHGRQATVYLPALRRRWAPAPAAALPPLPQAAAAQCAPARRSSPARPGCTVPTCPPSPSLLSSLLQAWCSLLSSTATSYRSFPEATRRRALAGAACCPPASGSGPSLRLRSRCWPEPSLVRTPSGRVPGAGLGRPAALVHRPWPGRRPDPASPADSLRPPPKHPTLPSKRTRALTHTRTAQACTRAALPWGWGKESPPLPPPTWWREPSLPRSAPGRSASSLEGST